MFENAWIGLYNPYHCNCKNIINIFINYSICGLFKKCWVYSELFENIWIQILQIFNTFSFHVLKLEVPLRRSSGRTNIDVMAGIFFSTLQYLHRIILLHKTKLFHALCSDTMLMLEQNQRWYAWPFLDSCWIWFIIHWW